MRELNKLVRISEILQPAAQFKAHIESPPMYQAIEAISKGGVIEPLEAVEFDENEHLVILRLSKTQVATAATSGLPADWKHWAGVLKDSPNLNDDPVATQRALRHDWD